MHLPFELDRGREPLSFSACTHHSPEQAARPCSDGSCLSDRAVTVFGIPSVEDVGFCISEETWGISGVIHLPDSELAMTEWGGGGKAEGKTVSGTSPSEGDALWSPGKSRKCDLGDPGPPRPAAGHLGASGGSGMLLFLPVRGGLLCRLGVGFRC